MMSLQNIKRELRGGSYAWPGGYPKFFIMVDGAALSFAAARENWREIVAAHLSAKQGERNNGWQVACCDVNWEDSNLYCDHSGARIESAYAD